MRFVKQMITLSTLWVLTACGTIDISAVSALIFPTRTSYPTPTGTMTLPPSATQNATTADMLAYRVQAARKMMQANAGSTFTGSLPDPLASIPVIEIHLNADGSIRALDVVRTPSFILKPWRWQKRLSTVLRLLALSRICRNRGLLTKRFCITMR